MAKRLTQPAIDRRDYKAKDGKVTYFPDAGKPGLMLKVEPTGSYKFVIFYRVAAGPMKGTQRKFTLDGLPSLSTARRLAQGVLDQVAQGGDPPADKMAAGVAAKEREGRAKAGIPEADSVAALAAAFMRSYAGSAKRSDRRKTRSAKTIKKTAGYLGMELQGGRWVPVTASSWPSGALGLLGRFPRRTSLLCSTLRPTHLSRTTALPAP